MHILPGQTGNARVKNFIRRHSGVELSPVYPEVIHARKQHGWADAQFADHIRQRFARRSRRKAAAVPEISRTYVLNLGSLTVDQNGAILQGLRADPEVEFAEPQHVYSTKQIPNDPFLSSSGTWGQPYPDLWGLINIGAPTAWNTALGDGIVVAVVDTGLDYNHPDLAANVWTNLNEIPGNGIDDDGNGFVDDTIGWDFVFNDNNPIDLNGHGTHVAGTIAAVGNNGIGIIGVAWHAQVMALKGLDDNGNGFDFTLAPAIVYAANNGADVINASWGGEGASQTIEEAIQFATGMGVVFVAAAGNSSEDAMNFFPANSPEAITVASQGPFGDFSFFSNFGSKIDVTAPGEDILSLQAANTFLAIPVIPGYGRLSGTSMAAPHVSGVAALVLSENSAYSTEQVRQIIRSSATNNPFDPRFGYGSLNAAAAVAVVNPLEARITGLQFGASPIDPITISGFAQGAGFSNYVLEYGFGSQPSFFTQFFSSATPVSGTLGQLDPSTLFSGTYTIRLTVFNTNGAGFIDRTQLTLNLVEITSPPAGIPTYKPGLLLPITGTATIPGFQNFTVQWSSQDGSTGLQSTGITLTGSGLSPLGNTQLATWDTSVITQAGYFNVFLTVNGAQSQTAVTTVYLDPDLLSVGWPAFVDIGPYFQGSGVVPALNPDGTFRLAMESPNQGTTPAASWVFQLDGTFQKTPLTLFGSVHQPAAGNVDGLPGDEAVMPDFNVVDVFHPDNSFDVFTPGIDVDLTRVPLLLEDLNNDFQLESITVGSDFNNNTAYVFAWQPNGQQAPGFPIAVEDNNSLNSWFNHTRVIVGDFDGDGMKDVLVHEGLTSTTYTLRLFNHDSTPKSFNAPMLTGIPFAMVAADLDHNGQLETILANYNGSQRTLHVFQPDGSERPGWPVDISLPAGNFFPATTIAVGDFNRDGHEEIVVSRESALFLFNSDGTLFSPSWPLTAANLVGYGPVVIADIDGDGFPEIVASLSGTGTSGLQLQAIRRDGSLAKSWQLTGNNGAFPSLYATPAVGDFNLDGTTDIAVAYQLQAPSGINPGIVTMLEAHSPFVPANNDWPLLLQNPRNNPVLLRTSAVNLAVTLTTGSNPSVIGDTLVFTATVTPNTAGGAIQFMDGASPISGSIQLSNGLASFSTSALAPGTHSITARYTGNNRFSASVSPAFVQTVNKGNSTVSVALTAGTNPATLRDSLTFTASVAPSATTGSVVFFDGARAISGSVPLVAGAASFTTSSLAAGTHSITAQYSGDATFNGGTSAPLLETVNTPKASPAVSIALAAGTNPSTFGSSLTFQATVAPGSATGTVTFFDGTSAISGPVPVGGGIASFTTSTLSGGPHSITAQYSGDTNFNPATSAPLIQNVTKLNTEVELELSVGDDAFSAGTSLRFTATVSPAAASGTVTFLDSGTAITGPIPLTNSTASFTTTTLSVGSHSITAQYSGNAGYNPSSSPAHKLSIK
jgi:subtilisin family serine protease